MISFVQHSKGNWHMNIFNVNIWSGRPRQKPALHLNWTLTSSFTLKHRKLKILPLNTTR
jgi:hypothetical protein